MFATAVFVFVTAWVIAYLAWMRYRLRQGQCVMIPAFANKLILLLGLAIVAGFDLSPLHLLWWFPLSYVLGALVLFSPIGVRLVMACLALLAWPGAAQKSLPKMLK